MKVEVNMEDVYGFDNESLAQLFADAIREEIRLAAKRLAKDAVKKMEAEAKKAIDIAVKKDWKKVAKVLEQLNNV